MGFDVEMDADFLFDVLNLPRSCYIREVVFDPRRRRVVVTVGGTNVIPTGPARVTMSSEDCGAFIKTSTEVAIPTREGVKTLLGRDVYRKRDE